MIVNMNMNINMNMNEIFRLLSFATSEGGRTDSHASTDVYVGYSIISQNWALTRAEAEVHPKKLMWPLPLAKLLVPAKSSHLNPT